MSGHLRTMFRFIRVMLRYRWAAASFFLRLVSVFPGFRRSVAHLQNRYEVKEQLRKDKQSIGHALGERTVVCSFMGHRIFELRLTEGGQATADQFFLNRPINDAKHVIALARRYIEIRAGDLVFDPGCGAGRHLFHFVDTYGCRAIGVDIYGPAIDVAETANWDRRVRFHAQSSLNPGFLDKVVPDGCDFVFINSWLNHVKDYPGYREFACRLVEKASFMLVITSAKDRLDDLFVIPDILVHEVHDGTRFALLRGMRHQNRPNHE